MRIQDIALGISLADSDFVEIGGALLVEAKIKEASKTLQIVGDTLRAAGYEIKSCKLALNSFEEWLPADATEASIRLHILLAFLEQCAIESCSLGSCSLISSLATVPSLLAISTRFSCSFAVCASNENSSPDYDRCHALAETILRLGSSDITAGIGSFSFCGSFNVPANCPLGPVSFHCRDAPPVISIALETADLLFLAFYAAETTDDASNNLQATIRQAVMPLQDAAITACKSASVAYAGIDLTISPGNTAQESIVSSIEYLKPHSFGKDGSLSALAVVASAVEMVARAEGIITCGFCGVHLPVLRDVKLASRAAENPPSFSLRDLVAYAAVAGVGLDLLPIPVDTSVDGLSAILLDLGFLSFRLNKPMMCR